MKGTQILYRTGTWNGNRWSGVPELLPNMVYTEGVVMTSTEVYYHFDLINTSVPSRLTISPQGDTGRKGSSTGRLAGIAVGVVVFVAGIIIVGFILCKRRKRLQEQVTMSTSFVKNYEDEESNEDMELPAFDISTIANATDHFALKNKLGEGGFGAVYKGKLAEGQEIAVKRLSKNSGQGLREFKNEVILIAKLQHRNLVKLLGCCIEGNERMLIYEFMPNKSLDNFIFDPNYSKSLDWPQRINIISGIARGLLYLHQDSRLRIIHRDLKASNVLLDNAMNPKISDFGMARTFGGDQLEGSTNRIVGTYGYMAPEYAVDGLFSIKSDVFSFGVLVLEIISGKKNRGFFHPTHLHNLLGHAWTLWNEGRQLELMDKSVEDSYSMSNVQRCIHVGLLCVQQRPEDRPTMSNVVVMLSSEVSLPQPKQPGFFTERNFTETESSSSDHILKSSHSRNEISFTSLEAR
ncbi:G-type lectin S-receptor-like serine/threonine-protein kinase SD1-1 [Turnera subulata]|uniref:non-specific serine/threonine protein kinase n=1 Tax=Turnera subulata TaxID=218843 RepID=A0A9Q0G452_9ROSI|nr:G-type lectin S-receptor-like serine/threonine-protein kinase SD1-1 [Turnera subulata]